MDSLRYWVTEMHVDGFRFDLASTLARELHEVDRLSAFFDLIQQDPVVSQVKLIAEPWDVGEGGYQVGNFPPLWSEWNGKYRDTRARLLARRAGRRWPSSPTASPAAPTCTRTTAAGPYASINFVTAHDGFTLRDLVSLQREAQRGQRRGQPRRREPQPLVELRRRGPDRRPRGARAAAPASSATSWPRCCCRRACRCCSAATRSAAPSGATTTPTARTTRSRWFDWERRRRSELLEFTRRLDRASAATTRSSAAGAGSRAGRSAASGVADIAWFTPDGDRDDRRATGTTGFAKSLGVFLNGDGHRRRPTSAASAVVDDSFLLLFNAHHEALDVHAARRALGRPAGRSCSTPPSRAAVDADGRRRPSAGQVAEPVDARVAVERARVADARCRRGSAP